MGAEPVVKPTLSVYVRWMIPNDMPEVMRIERASFDDPWHWCRGEQNPPKNSFVFHLRQRKTIGMVAEYGKQNKIAGYIVYELHKTRIHVINFAVSPDFRRMGVGCQMIDKLKNKLSFQKRNRLVLEVRESNMDAQCFYRAMSFRAVSILRDFYINGEYAYRFVFRHRNS